MFVVYALLAYTAMALAIAGFVLGRSRRRLRKEFGGYPSGLGWPGPGGAEVTYILHRGSARGRPLRFYRSPLIGPDFPWSPLQDLFAIATEGAGYDVSAEWIYGRNPMLAQMAMTDEGAQLLLSHWAAQELLASLVSDAAERLALAAAFRELMAEAYVLQWAGLSRAEFLRLCALADRRPHSAAF